MTAPPPAPCLLALAFLLLAGVALAAPACPLEELDDGYCVSEREYLDAAQHEVALEACRVELAGTRARLDSEKARADDFDTWVRRSWGHPPTLPEAPRERSWWDRHGFGIGVVAGVLGTATLVVAMGQLLRVEVAL